MRYFSTPAIFIPAARPASAGGTGIDRSDRWQLVIVSGWCNPQPQHSSLGDLLHVRHTVARKGDSPRLCRLAAVAAAVEQAADAPKRQTGKQAGRDEIGQSPAVTIDGEA